MVAQLLREGTTGVTGFQEKKSAEYVPVTSTVPEVNPLFTTMDPAPLRV